MLLYYYNIIILYYILFYTCADILHFNFFEWRKIKDRREFLHTPYMDK